MAIVKLRALVIVGVAFSTLWAGCTAAPAGPVPDESLERGEEELYAMSSAIWPSPVTVCWVNPSEAHASAMEWTRKAVAGTWEAASAVRFVGWGACGAEIGDAVRIRISDERPWSFIGTGVRGQETGMVLNFTFSNFSTEYCKKNRAFCVKAIAVHEFGHLLGFDHEQNRPDAPEWCQEDAVRSGDTAVGPWDKSSVMNYCNPKWNGDGKLSPVDKAGVQKLYGKSPDAPEGGACMVRCCDGLLAGPLEEESASTCHQDSKAVCSGHGAVKRSTFEGEEVYERPKGCYAKCGGAGGYRRLKGVTSSCTSAAKSFCKSRGGFRDAKWSQCG